MYILKDVDVVSGAGNAKKVTGLHTTCRTDGGTMSCTTIYHIDQGGIVKNALAGLGQASMRGEVGLDPGRMSALETGAAMGKGVVDGVTCSGTVSVGPLTQVSSGKSAKTGKAMKATQ